MPKLKKGCRVYQGQTKFKIGGVIIELVTFARLLMPAIIEGKMKIQIHGNGINYRVKGFFIRRKLKKLGLDKCINVPGMATREKGEAKNTESTLKRLRQGYKACVYKDGRILTLRKL